MQKRMRRKKNCLSQTALLVPDSEHYWRSMQLIRAGILEAYRHLDPAVEVASVHRDLRFVLSGRFRKLIVIDTYFHPVFMVDRLETILREEGRPNPIQEFCFHIYGDFARNAPEWARLLKWLRGRRVSFIVSSVAQAGHVGAFFGQENLKSISVVPYSLPEAHSTHEHFDRDAARRKQGFMKRDFVLVYAGRISLQKNVHVLIEFLARFLEKNPSVASRLRLEIAGTCDDVGLYQWNCHFKLRAFANSWQKWFRSLPDKVRRLVRFHGFLDSSKLRSLLSAADTFVSLSTSHEEDFGMAPLEALCSGCPAILSGWGGYHGFNLMREAVHYIAVRPGEKELEIDFAGFERALMKLIVDGPEPELVRNRRAALYRNRFSTRESSRAFELIQSRPFPVVGKTSPLLAKYADKVLQQRARKGSVHTTFSRSESIYAEAYGAYFGSSIAFSSDLNATD